MAKLHNYASFIFVVIFIQHVICQSTCSGVQYKQNEQGYITSNIGGNYAAYSNCTWYFSPPSTNYTFITITFTQFDTEANWDYVNIYDGPSEAFPRIFQYSGTVLPSPVTLSSTQPDLTIVFTSDSIVQYSGFTIFYQYQTGTPPPCSGTREIYYGSTLDMVFPSLDASTQLECNWIIYSDDYDISYDYTAYTSLESISDPANALTIEVYAGTSIGYSPFVIYDSTSPLYQQSSYEFYSTTPNLYVKLSVYGGPASQPTSFSLSYEFDQGDYNGYSYPSTNDNFIAIFLGCFFGGFGFICLVVFSFVFCGRNRCGGGARTGGLFLFAWSSSRRNQDTITTTSVTQVPASHVTVTPQQQPELVQYVPMQSQQPQQAPAYLPPTNPELGLQTYPQQYYPPQPQPYVPVTVAYPGPVQTNPQQPLQSNPYLYYGPS